MENNGESAWHWDERHLNVLFDTAAGVLNMRYLKSQKIALQHVDEKWRINEALREDVPVDFDLQTRGLQDTWLCEDFVEGIVEGLLVVTTVVLANGKSIHFGCCGRAQAGGSASTASGVAGHNHGSEAMSASTVGSIEASSDTFRVQFYIFVGEDRRRGTWLYIF